MSDESPKTPDDWLRALLQDSAFRPVLVTTCLIAATLLGWLLSMGVVQRRTPALAALALLLLLTADVLQRDLRRRRFGLAARGLALLWLLGALAAAAAVRLGVF